MSGPIAAPTRQRPDVWRFSTSGALIVKAGESTAHNDTGKALVVSLVRVSCGTAPTGSPLVITVRKDGAVLAAVSLPAGAKTIAAAPTITTLEQGAALTVDVTAIGSVVAGADLTVSVVIN